MKGYFGKFLKIDLTNSRTEELPISDEDQKKYIGGISRDLNIYSCILKVNLVIFYLTRILH